MNTAAAIFGFVGSLLLIVQPAVALWFRRDTARTRETLEAGERVDSGGRGPRLSAVPGAEISERRA